MVIWMVQGNGMDEESIQRRSDVEQRAGLGGQNRHFQNKPHATRSMPRNLPKNTTLIFQKSVQQSYTL